MMVQRRENVFDFLKDDISSDFYKKEYKIPESLVNGSKEKDKTGSDIMIFEYDIPNKCFYFKGYQQPVSIFFEIYRKHHNNTKADDFIVVKISEKNEQESIMLRDQVVGNILQNGVIFKGKKYEIVGCSNSQVQKKSFMFGKVSLGCGQIVEKEYIPEIKEVERKKGVAKRVKYAGLLFTGCRYMLDLPDDIHVSFFSQTHSTMILRTYFCKSGYRPFKGRPLDVHTMRPGRLVPTSLKARINNFCNISKIRNHFMVETIRSHF